MNFGLNPQPLHIFSQAGGKRAEGIEDALNFALEHFQEFIQK
ncbi:unnamed protein product [marine sediment metagenome]|uniref:Uncharacterized protein n=1 Tax=marine sediment metagenome TaxID=412755 RepID=X1B511_9ZZZZ